MPRFVQPAPTPPDPYATDRALRATLRRHLDSGQLAEADARLAAPAADVTATLRDADADAHPPTLRRYDPWGARVDAVEASAGWEALRAAAARHAVVALPYQDSARSVFGARARVVQHALLHVYGPESA